MSQGQGSITYGGPSGGGGGAGNPAPPLQSIQFNDNSVFGGDAALLFDKVAKNVALLGTMSMGSGAAANNAMLTMDSDTVALFILRAILTVQGWPPGVNTFGNFWETLEQTTMNEDGQRDCVWQFGYNQSGTGGKMNSGEAAMWDSWESNFIPFFAGPRNFERHFEVSFENNVNKRLSSYTFAKAAPGAVNLDWRIDSFNCFNSDTEELRFGWGPKGNFMMRGDQTVGGASISLQDVNGSCKLDINSQVAGTFITSYGIPIYLEGQTVRFGGDNGGSPINNPIFVTDHYTAGANSSIYIDAQSANAKSGLHMQGPVDALMDIVISNDSTVVGAQAAVSIFCSGSDATNQAFIHFKNQTTGSSAYVLMLNDGTMLFATANPSTSGGFLTTININPTGAVNIGGAALSSSAGFAPPRMTTVDKLAITSPEAGIQVYDTTLNQMSYYNGTTWVNF